MDFSQARLDGLNHMANSFLRAGAARAQLDGLMKDHFSAVTRDTGRRIVQKDGSGDGVWFTFFPFPPNYARITKPNGVRFLSARIDGVIMSANFQKPQVYDHENAHVANALRQLAKLIEEFPERLADRDVELKLD